METIEEVEARHAAELKLAEDAAALAEGIPAPSFICNRDAAGVHTPRAWLCYRAPAYDPDGGYDAVAVLRGLEAAGWRPQPSSMAAWDDYAPCFVPCDAAAAGATPRRGADYRRFREATDVYPLTVEINSFTMPEARLHMVAPDGLAYLVVVEVPALRAGVYGEASGGADWRYVRHWLNRPQAWPCLSAESRCPTGQSIQGTIYFRPRSLPEKQSDALKQLLEAT